MVRPNKDRWIEAMPPAMLFKPAGIPARELQEVVLTMDEFEAMRLADRDGLYQAEVADRLGVSRATAGRIITSARRKVASAIASGHAIRIEGGTYQIHGDRTFKCHQCGHLWHEPFGTGRPTECPKCGSDSVRREDGKGRGGRRNRHRDGR